MIECPRKLQQIYCRSMGDKDMKEKEEKGTLYKKKDWKGKQIRSEKRKREVHAPSKSPARGYSGGKQQMKCPQKLQQI